MSETYEMLWSQLRELLKTRGELPLRYELLTPAEIARHIAASSKDVRVRRFVLDYYYPRRYGHLQGAIADAEATELVASFIARPLAAAAFDPDAVRAADARAQPGDPALAPCGLCGRRVTNNHAM
jgi:hypothetical protein